MESCLQVLRRPHEFKIRALEDIRALFPQDWNPFFAGDCHPHAVLSAGLVHDDPLDAPLAVYANALQQDLSHYIGEFCSTSDYLLKRAFSELKGMCCQIAQRCWLWASQICCLWVGTSTHAAGPFPSVDGKLDTSHFQLTLEDLENTRTSSPRGEESISDLFMV